MATSVQDVLADVQAILLANGGIHVSYGLAYNNLTTALSNLNFSGVPVLNVKLSNPPTVVLDLVQE